MPVAAYCIQVRVFSKARIDPVLRSPLITCATVDPQTPRHDKERKKLIETGLNLAQLPVQPEENNRQVTPGLGETSDKGSGGWQTEQIGPAHRQRYVR